MKIRDLLQLRPETFYKNCMLNWKQCLTFNLYSNVYYENLIVDQVNYETKKNQDILTKTNPKHSN